MNPYRIILAIPVLPAIGGWFKNRRNPRGWLCAPADVMFNAADRYFCWVNRVGGGTIFRDKEGRHEGSADRAP